ncbi:hypothetical protein [Streptomyces sp. KL116D]|uniref:hypothetical protein n=1 Tax=Streptomyces sp. KL116D TaxID=3045152 RepID=UPI0035590287
MQTTALDWAVRTTDGYTVSCDSRDTATELAADKPHLTVIYRRPGGRWFTFTAETPMRKLDAAALAECGDVELNERPEVQHVSEDMVREHVIDAGELPRYSAAPFAAWLHGAWTEYTADGAHTNGDVIARALADWRGQ